MYLSFLNNETFYNLAILLLLVRIRTNYPIEVLQYCSCLTLILTSSFYNTVLLSFLPLILLYIKYALRTLNPKNLIYCKKSYMHLRIDFWNKANSES